MKNSMILILLFISSVGAHCQVLINNANINDSTHVNYVELVGYDMGAFKKNLVVVVDYGQKVKNSESQTIAGKDGKSIKFDSMIDALNFMSNNGWEFVSAYPISIPQSGSVYHYLLKRKK